MSFPRGVMLLSACVFLVFGAWGFVAPANMVTLVDVHVPNATARADVRAQYGGFTFGMGAFLLACAARPHWIVPGLAASFFTLSGFAFARAISAIGGDPDDRLSMTIYYLMAAEATGAILSLIGWRIAAKG